MRIANTKVMSVRNEDGLALISVIMLGVMAMLLTGALTVVTWTAHNGTAMARGSETSRAMAEGGLNAALFKVEAATAPSSGTIGIETYLATALGTATAGSPRPNTTQFTGTAPGGSWVVTLSDPVAGDNFVTLSSTGTDAVSGRTKTIVAIARAESVEALDYAMFGNKIEFHNHNKVPNGLILNTEIWSNGAILIDKAVSILGRSQAVNMIQPNTGPAAGTALASTSLSPPGEQGDPNPSPSVANAPVIQAVPAPAIKPFPTFDFDLAASTAEAAGRKILPSKLLSLIANARACAAAMPADGTPRLPGYSGSPVACNVNTVYHPSAGVAQAEIPLEMVHYKTTAGNPAPRHIAVPNAATPGKKVPLGSLDGVSNPAIGTDLYEIRLLGNPLADTLLFVSGELTLTGTTTTLLQIQGGLIVNGALSVQIPAELLSWHNRVGDTFVSGNQTLYTPIATTLAQAAAGQPYDVIYSNWPAIAANGKVNIKDSGGGGNGGPVHIEGTVYSVAESHFHKSDAYESSYAVGSEIADSIHNCQWFSFAYDPQAKKTLGLYGKASGRAKLQVIRLEER